MSIVLVWTYCWPARYPAPSKARKTFASKAPCQNLTRRKSSTITFVVCSLLATLPKNHNIDNYLVAKPGPYDPVASGGQYRSTSRGASFRQEHVSKQQKHWGDPDGNAAQRGRQVIRRWRK